MSIGFLTRKSPSRDALLAENIALRNELSEARRQLAQALAHKPADVRVERTGCARIADLLGINERTVRQILTSHAKFAKVREALAAQGSTITRDRKFLAYLAEHLEQWPS